MSPGRSIGMMVIVGALLLWALLSVIEGFPAAPQPQCIHTRTGYALDIKTGVMHPVAQCDVWAP